MESVHSNIKSLAEFARIALEHQLISTVGIRSWGDTLIEQVEVAPNWMIDLAMIEPGNAFHVWDAIPGTADSQEYADMICALLQRRWQTNTIDIETVRRIGWDFHLDDLIPTLPDEPANWGATLEAECEGFHEGWRTESEIRKLITQSLTRYNTILDDLPVWVDEHSPDGKPESS